MLNRSIYICHNILFSVISIYVSIHIIPPYRIQWFVMYSLSLSIVMEKSTQIHQKTNKYNNSITILLPGYKRREILGRERTWGLPIAKLPEIFFFYSQ